MKESKESVKESVPELVVVTASVNPEKTEQFWKSWRETGKGGYRLVFVLSGRTEIPEEVTRNLRHGDEVVLREKIDGTIPAFLAGVKAACNGGVPKVIACFHDDLEILPKKDKEAPDWDTGTVAVFSQNPKVILAGFGGGTGLGSEEIYKTEYNPMQLARQDFVSNMKDAEVHGRRNERGEEVACLDGFTQIGRGDFILECFQALTELGIRHHAYDSMIGMWAHAAGFKAVMLPVFCHHQGGMTAVGSEEYQKWAMEEKEEGDLGFWKEAHEIFYEEGKGVLPFSVKGEER